LPYIFWSNKVEKVYLKKPLQKRSQWSIHIFLLL
jgi:hypothetical protein